MRPLTSRTRELVRRLSEEARPMRVVPSLGRFMAVWAIACTLFFAPALWLAPTRWDMGYRVAEPVFWVETGLWVLAAAACAAAVYRGSIPGMVATVAARRRERLWTGLPIAAAIGIWASRLGSDHWLRECSDEMSLWRGRCGFIIFALGLAVGTLYFRWARRAAPVHPASTGVWAALSAGSLGAFSMQLICAHDNGLHLWIWHVVPMALLAGLGAVLGEKHLRWSK